MALAHFTLPPPPTSPISSSPPISSFPSPILPSKNAQRITSTPTTIGRGRLALPPPRRRSNRFSSCFPVRTSSSSSLDTVGPTPTVGQVTEVTKDTFWPIVNSAGDKTVVLDMYTQWCGPCKVIAPKFQQLSEKYLDVVFLKLDCNQENKPLAKELGIRVVPTFKILKDSKIVKEVTGAKFDDLALAIETVRPS